MTVQYLFLFMYNLLQSQIHGRMLFLSSILVQQVHPGVASAGVMSIRGVYGCQVGCGGSAICVAMKPMVCTFQLDFALQPG